MKDIIYIILIMLIGLIGSVAIGLYVYMLWYFRNTPISEIPMWALWLMFR